MADFAIRAEGIGKRYRLRRVESGYKQLRRYLQREEQQWLWALKDLSFEIGEGVSTAIIGRNGAGKSTLLKLLARITEPTEGYADIVGRVGALLEVGTGFHPELTGRENIYFNGAILGMRKPEIDRKLDEIVAFSGVEDHLDKPVKWYSSGMYVRLGFAVAAHLEPEILIVDEVLAVGDAEFQKRCLMRMNDVAHEGRTVLFVSHNMQAIRRLCDRGILLEQGRLVMEGDVASVTQYYLSSIDAADDGVQRWPRQHRPGNEIAEILEVRVTDEHGQPSGSFFSSKPINVTVEFDLAVVDPAFTVGIDLLTGDGVLVFTSYQRDMPDDALPPFAPGRNAFRCTIPPGLLNGGRYMLNLRVSLHNRRFIALEEGILQFDVVVDHGDSIFLNAQARAGVILPPLEWAAVEPGGDEAVQAVPVRASASR
ncbi:MAG TPA: ABC transporter ATP-binding protein [Gaiellaceae bacterium]|nr:ABC transporter ATP-binding protein [Gaiellaceae bacterium]